MTSLSRYLPLKADQPKAHMNAIRKAVQAKTGTKPTDSEIFDGVQVERYPVNARRPNYNWKGQLLQVQHATNRKRITSQ
jgi:hypothetical protein